MPSQLYLPLMSAIRNHSTAALCVSLKQPRPSAFQLALINLKFTAVALYMTPPKQSPFKQYLHISVLHCPPRKVLNASPPLWGSCNGPERTPHDRDLGHDEWKGLCVLRLINICKCLRVGISTQRRQRSICEEAIVPMVAASSRVIMSALLLPLFKDKLALLLRGAINLGREMEEHRQRDKVHRGCWRWTLVLYCSSGLWGEK